MLLFVTVYTFSVSNFLTVLGYAGGTGQNLVNACIACVVASVAALIVGIIIGFGNGEGGSLKNFKSKKA